MRIGIVPALERNKGGIYQYSLTLLRALNEWPTDDELILLNFDGAPPPSELDPARWEVRAMQYQSATDRALDGLRRIIGNGPHRAAWRQLRQVVDRQLNWNARTMDAIRFRSDLNALFRKWQLDFVVYAWPTPISFESRVPYVMAIHDIQHRLQPEFPEVSANGEWQNREYCFRNGVLSATLLMVDSEVGKEDVLNCYGNDGATADRIKVLPFLPASYLGSDTSAQERARVRAAYRVPHRFLFYPAQFWPHKNHVRIVQALGLLKEQQALTLPIVFCGSHSGESRERTYQEVMTTAARMGIEHQIHYLGYVPDEDMAGMYAEAAALVMPTFFGPTNIPILEAWAYGCPVLTSDIRGIREQCGDAAVLVDPRSVDGMARGIHQLWTDGRLTAELAERGRRRLASYTPDDFRARVVDTMEDAKARTRFAQRQVASS